MNKLWSTAVTNTSSLATDLPLARVSAFGRAPEGTGSPAPFLKAEQGGSSPAARFSTSPAAPHRARGQTG
jgi:hypothetical protein